MPFSFTRRTARINPFNNRVENHGDEHVPAMDLPISFEITDDEIDKIVLPPPESESETTSFPSILDFMYDANDKLVQPYLAKKLLVHRTPDNLDFTLFYDQSDDRKKLQLKNVKAKDVSLSFRSGTVKAKIAMSLQMTLKPEQYQDILMCQKEDRDIIVTQTQEDLFEPQGETASKKKTTKKAAKKSTKKAASKKKPATKKKRTKKRSKKASKKTA